MQKHTHRHLPTQRHKADNLHIALVCETLSILCLVLTFAQVDSPSVSPLLSLSSSHLFMYFQRNDANLKARNKTSTDAH